jgi:hypothetical protein
VPVGRARAAGWHKPSSNYLFKSICEPQESLGSVDTRIAENLGLE